jgi:membrane fusion protein (multidrug efflux system)
MKNRTETNSRLTLAGCLAALAIALSACSDEQASPPSRAQGPIDVGVVTLASEAVPFSMELPGRVLASSTAEIRPQVNGIVREKAFREGSEVAAGDVLYRLDDDTFQAAHEAAASALQGAEAGLAGAQNRFDRTQRLAESNTASAQALDDARVELLQAQAGVASATAALAAARINLDNTVITAPIPGLIGTSSVSVGSLVTANQQEALATIRQIDPVNVDLMDTAANRLRLRAQVAAGTLGRDREQRPTVRLVLEDGSAYPETGTISLTDVVISETTGSFALRASFANPRRLLRPGMFVRATVQLGNTPNAFLVPQRAVTRNAAGKATAFFVGEEGKVEARVIETGRAIGNDWLVTAGVGEGDRVVVDGLQRISDGTAVTPVEVAIDADGVVRQEIAAPQATPQATPRAAPQADGASQ